MRPADQKPFPARRPQLILHPSSFPLTSSQFIANFVANFADEKIRIPGAWTWYQHESSVTVFEAVIRQQAKVFTNLWSRQTGKTERISITDSAIAFYVITASWSSFPVVDGLPYGAELEASFPEGFATGIFGCDDDAYRRDYDRIQRIMRRVKDTLGLKSLVDNTERMTLVGPGRNGELRRVFHMEGNSAAPAAKVEGGTFDKVNIEEAQDVEKDKIMQGINPTLSSRAGTMELVGTVGDRKCYFDEVIDYNKAYRPDQHFEVSYEVAIAANYQFGRYKTFVDQQNKDSLEFRRKFKLERNYEKGMLITETGFLGIADPFAKRWPLLSENNLVAPHGSALSAGPHISSKTNRGEGGVGEPWYAVLERHIVVVMALDVAQAHDRTVLKIGAADWKRVRKISLTEEIEGDKSQHRLGVIPRVTTHWKKTYPGQDYDHQFAEIIRDLDRWFPGIAGFAILAIDATGDRGDMAPRFQKRGFTVIPVNFTGGTRSIAAEELLNGGKQNTPKSTMCWDYTAALESGQFVYAADEQYMGTVDYYRCIGERIPDGHSIVEPDPEYAKHKHEMTHCFDETPRPGVRDLHKDKKDPDAHDDEVDSDMLLELAAKYCRPFSMDNVHLIGPERTTTATLPDSSLRESFASLDRIFQL